MDQQDLIRIIKNLPWCVIALDRDRNITVFNREAEKLTGLPEHQVMGKKCCDIIKTPLCKDSCAVENSPGQNMTISGHDIIPEREDRPIPVCMNVTPLKDDRKNITGYIVISRDLRGTKEPKKDPHSRYEFSNIITRNHRIQEIFDLVETISDCDVSVLIQGESGTGKELIAHAIHNHSRRRDRPFAVLNCGAISETLLESELFGHVKGAFTGAYRDKEGRFEAAHGGTLILDEIGDISVNMQIKLLRVLQTGRFEKVGDHRTIEVDVRIIAATNKNLNEEILKGNFREDLFYRLNVVPVFLPPLRERKEDIPLLVRHFIHIFNKKNNRNIKDISLKAMELLMNYDWPGNIRELKNIVECSLVCAKNNVIEPSSIPVFIKDSRHVPGNPFSSLNGQEHPSEKEKIMCTLKGCMGNRTAAAEALNIDRTTLWRKIKKYGINSKSISTNLAN